MRRPRSLDATRPPVSIRRGAPCATPTQGCATPTTRPSTASAVKTDPALATAVPTPGSPTRADPYAGPMPSLRRRTTGRARLRRALLGWYLGDGCIISRGRRDVYALHIFNDAAYPALNDRRRGSDDAGSSRGGRPHTSRALRCCRGPRTAGSTGRACSRSTGRGASTSGCSGWRLAVGPRARASGRLPARAVPLRRLPGQQLGDPAGGRRDEALRLPPVAVHQLLRRDPAVVLRRPRPAGRPVAQVQRRRRSRCRRGQASPGSTS